MRGIGGPLLCIGDLLSDVGGEADAGSQVKEESPVSPSSTSSSTPSVSLPTSDHNLRPSDLPKLFQEVDSGMMNGSPGMCLGHLPSKALDYPRKNYKIQENYDLLNEALAGTDHSWTALTLKLCSSLESANKLVQSTNSHVGVLSQKVGELEKVIKRGDSAIAAVKSVHYSLNTSKESSFTSQNPDSK